MFDDAIRNAIQEFLNKLLVDGTSFSLSKMTGMFNSSINALRSEVAITPTEFDVNMLDILKSVSETVVLPIAILLITYVFVLQIIEMITDKNKGNDFDIGQMSFLIIKTAIMISLATNAFTIALGFSDLSTWMIEKVPTEEVEMKASVEEKVLESLKPQVVNKESKEVVPNLEKVKDKETQEMYYKIGEGTITMMISFIALIFTMVIGGIIYLVAWSRIITILLYITIAPIPMATVMSDSWVNSIGQNYLKNLFALTIQGFLMLVLLIIYNGLVSRTAGLIEAGESGLQGIILMLVSMGIVARMLMKTQAVAKSITGAS